MCGLVGMLDTRGRRSYSGELLRQMNDTLVHRGPDEDGVHLEPGVALGHRRLSIIDLATGQQPLFNEDGSVVVVFNGEIYNHRQLMPELESLGTCSAPAATPRSSCMRGRPGASAAWSASAACLPSPSGTATGAACSWRATGSASSPCITRCSMTAPSVRLGAEGAHRPSGLPASSTRSAVEQYFALGYVADPHCIYRAVRKLPPGHLLSCRRAAAARAGALLGCALHAGQPARRRRCGRGIAGPHRRVGTAPADLGAAAGRVPVGRRGLECGGGDHGRARRPPGAHLLDRLRRRRHSTKAAMRRWWPRVTARIHHVERVESTISAWWTRSPTCMTNPMPTARPCRLTGSASLPGGMSLSRCRVTVATRASAATARYRMHLAEERVRAKIPQGLRRLRFRPARAIYPKADWAPRPFRAQARPSRRWRARPRAAYLHSVSVLRADERDRLYSRQLRSELAGYSTDACSITMPGVAAPTIRSRWCSTSITRRGWSAISTPRWTGPAWRIRSRSASP
jgi:asparagine synthase (glutamine-hydrolysing)